jgi:hypothetical protein
VSEPDDECQCFIPGMTVCTAHEGYTITGTPTEPDDNAWRYVRCPQCGTVAHQPIPEDEWHCPCGPNYDDEYGTGYRRDCPCPCHEGEG